MSAPHRVKMITDNNGVVKKLFIDGVEIKCIRASVEFEAKQFGLVTVGLYAHVTVEEGE